MEISMVSLTVDHQFWILARKWHPIRDGHGLLNIVFGSNYKNIVLCFSQGRGFSYHFLLWYSFVSLWKLIVRLSFFCQPSVISTDTSDSISADPDSILDIKKRLERIKNNSRNWGALSRATGKAKTSVKEGRQKDVKRKTKAATGTKTGQKN